MSFFFSRFFNFNLDISKFLNLSIYLYQLLKKTLNLLRNENRNGTLELNAIYVT